MSYFVNMGYGMWIEGKSVRRWRRRHDRTIRTFWFQDASEREKIGLALILWGQAIRSGRYRTGELIKVSR